MTRWNLQVYGLVDQPMLLSFEDVKAFPKYESKNDIHCVTGWSRLDNVWQGVRARDIAEKAGVKEEAGYVILHAEEGWTTNLPLDDFLAETSLLAYAHNGEPLTPEHGFRYGVYFRICIFEKRQVAARHPIYERKPSGLLGAEWLSHERGSLAKSKIYMGLRFYFKQDHPHLYQVFISILVVCRYLI